MDLFWCSRAAGWRLPRVMPPRQVHQELTRAVAGAGHPACPWLPAVAGNHDYTLTRRHGSAKGADFYLDALRYSHALWLAGLPARAILFLNKAWSAELPVGHPVLRVHPPPYAALVWILRRAAGGDCGFLGNPLRHFQHLGSRMNGPRAPLRAWRAWVCFHLAARSLPAAGFPADGRQLAREGLWIPGFRRALDALAVLGWPEEARLAEQALQQESGAPLLEIHATFPPPAGFNDNLLPS